MTHGFHVIPPDLIKCIEMCNIAMMMPPSPSCRSRTDLKSCIRHFCCLFAAYPASDLHLLKQKNSGNEFCNQPCNPHFTSLSTLAFSYDSRKMSSKQYDYPDELSPIQLNRRARGFSWRYCSETEER